MKTMKRALAVVLMAVMVLACATAAFAEKSIYTTGSCNLRTGAGLAYESINTVPKGTNLTATATKTDNRGVKWYKVKYHGDTGWVSSVYCKSGSRKTSGKTVVATGNTHIRAKGNLDGRKLGTLHTGETATYLNKSTVDERGVRWYKISYAGITGWVSSVNSYVK